LVSRYCAVFRVAVKFVISYSLITNYELAITTFPGVYCAVEPR
jgi:hypothetical protein